jgi:hypothetical protein
LGVVQVSRISQYPVVPFIGGGGGGDCWTDEWGNARVVRGADLKLILSLESDYGYWNRHERD